MKGWNFCSILLLNLLLVSCEQLAGPREMVTPIKADCFTHVCNDVIVQIPMSSIFDYEFRKDIEEQGYSYIINSLGEKDDMVFLEFRKNNGVVVSQESNIRKWLEMELYKYEVKHQDSQIKEFIKFNVGNVDLTLLLSANGSHGYCLLDSVNYMLIHFAGSMRHNDSLILSSIRVLPINNY